jgi:hypothetical protein
LASFRTFNTLYCIVKVAKYTIVSCRIYIIHTDAISCRIYIIGIVTLANTQHLSIRKIAWTSITNNLSIGIETATHTSYFIADTILWTYYTFMLSTVVYVTGIIYWSTHTVIILWVYWCLVKWVRTDTRTIEIYIRILTSPLSILRQKPMWGLITVDISVDTIAILWTYTYIFLAILIWWQTLTCFYTLLIESYRNNNP